MEFQIYPAFIDSLARLTAEEQKAAKIAALDLQINRAQPSLRFHRLEKLKARDFWSAWVNDDLRLIVHHAKSRLLFCYAGHHNRAYDWARGHKIETDPGTRAAKLVELPEAVQGIAVPDYVEGERPALPKSPLFAHITERELLSHGVPRQWLPDVRRVADEDALLDLAEHLPGEVAEALVILATVAKPNQGEDAKAALLACDWVYFATSPPEDFDRTRNFVRKFRTIIRTAFTSAGTPVANVKRLRQGDTILLVHGGGPSKKPYRPVCSCTVAAPPRPVPGFDALTFADASQQKSLRNSGYTPDPHFDRFTGISIKAYRDFEHLTCSISRPPGTHTIRHSNEVFPAKARTNVA
jgi:plasmid maintenance system killer protein